MKRLREVARVAGPGLTTAAVISQLAWLGQLYILVRMIFG